MSWKALKLLLISSLILFLLCYYYYCCYYYYYDYHYYCCHLQIGAGLQSNSNNLQTMCEAGGFKRITQLLQWAAFTFPPVAHRSSHGPTASQAPRPHSPSHKGGSPKSGLKSLAFRSGHTHSARGVSLPLLLCSCLFRLAGLHDPKLLTFENYLQLRIGCV